jgi:hypothetical protein
MTKHCKVTVVLAVFLSAVFSASAANPTPKVVFIGDWITYDWPVAAANPNWIDQGTPGLGFLGQGSSSATAARFQADVVNLHPATVHIMVGNTDWLEAGDATWQYFTSSFLSSLNNMVQQANAANIQVVLGIEPGTGPMIASVIASYGALHRIPVINYADALCACVGSLDGSSIGVAGVNISAIPNSIGEYVLSPYTTGSAPTAVGYALMTQMAEAVISTVNARLLGGYLQNVVQVSDNEPQGSNVNTTPAGATIQFTAMGYYNTGLVLPFVNSSFAGSNGTWASSNPLVVYINQMGIAWTISPGTAIITYATPNGVKFNEWVQYVSQY